VQTCSNWKRLFLKLLLKRQHCQVDLLLRWQICLKSKNNFRNPGFYKWRNDCHSIFEQWHGFLALLRRINPLMEDYFPNPWNRDAISFQNNLSIALNLRNIKVKFWKHKGNEDIFWVTSLTEKKNCSAWYVWLHCVNSPMWRLALVAHWFNFHCGCLQSSKCFAHASNRFAMPIPLLYFFTLSRSLEERIFSLRNGQAECY